MYNCMRLKKEDLFNMKKPIKCIVARKMTIHAILREIARKDHFLIIGHLNPDEDCLASMTAIALIISKFRKDVKLYCSGVVHEHFQFLLNICKYNSIHVLTSEFIIQNKIGAIIICDTPKPSMMDVNDQIMHIMNDPAVTKIEIDHHTGADSEYIGDPGYRYVMEASSTAELIGLMVLSLKRKFLLRRRLHIADPLSRNVVLSLITGIIGDSKMGVLLKSRREKKNYNFFVGYYNDLLKRETQGVGNFFDKMQVYEEIQRISNNEARCYNYIIKKKQYTDHMAYIVLTADDMSYLANEHGRDTIISVSRSIADDLAEDSGCISLVSYWDELPASQLVEFRMRRSKSFRRFDLRDVITYFSIHNGGGHEGAIGFRIQREEINDQDAFVKNLAHRIDSELLSKLFS